MAVPSGILTGESTEAVARAERENLYEFWAHFGRAAGRQLHEEPGLAWFETGIKSPLMNGVLEFRSPRAEADGRIATVLDRFRARGLPLQWTTKPSDRPGDLGDRLLAHGLVRVFDLPAMSIDLSGATDPPVPPGLRIRHVLDRPMLDAWVRVGLGAFEVPASVHPDFADLEASLGLEWSLPWRRYLGTLDGEPVGSSMAFYHAGVVGIYYVGTVPGSRRRGFGAALTGAPMRDARGLGYRWGVLQASPMGEPVYRRMRFREHSRYTLYTTPH